MVLKRLYRLGRRMANQHQPWTKEEDDFIAKWYGVKTYADMACDLPGRSRNAVKIRAGRICIRDAKNLWSQEELDILHKEYPVNPHITDLLPNRRWENIKQKARKEGLRIRYGRYKFDPYFFKPMTRESAYVAGFIAADGYLNIRANRIEICVKKSDVDLLRDIARLMKFNGPIYEKPKVNAVRLQITSQKILSDLFDILGVYSNKTLALGDVDIDNVHMSHFLRGYCDGDGYLRNGYPTVRILGTYRFLGWASSNIHKAINVREKTPKRKGHENVFEIDYHGSDAISICRWMYADATIYLQRKYNRYVNWLPERHSAKCHAPDKGEDIVGSIGNNGVLDIK